MAEGLNVHLTEPLRRFVEERSGPQGVYGSASEYIRDLIRHDYEREKERRWKVLEQELRAGLEAPEDQFQAFEPQSIIADAKAEKARLNGR